MTNSFNEKDLNYSRFTLAVPIDLFIKMEISREKAGLKKTGWICEAISEKIEAEEKKAENEKYNLEEIKNELKQIRELLLKR